MNKLFARLILILLTLLVGNPGSVWAVQSHGGAEGLVSHQLGHFLFTIGMGYLIYRLYSVKVVGAGWPEFKVFLWLLILWNIATFTGHWMNEFVSRDKFVMSHGHIISFSAENFSDVIFYLTRLDHLVLVPAFVFLVLALRKWRTQS